MERLLLDGGAPSSKSARGRGGVYAKYLDAAFRSMVKTIRDAKHFKVGDDEKVPLKEIVRVVARVADAEKWPTFGSASPASVDEVERAAKSAGFHTARLKRARWHGKEKTGLFALGVDAVEGPRAEPTVAAEETTTATVYVCGCGYKSLDATAIKRHGERCAEAVTRLAKARLRRRDGGALEARFYSCTNPECKFGRTGRTWLSRQAAFAHGKARGCLTTSDRASFEILQ
jgi:hypothetical protein